MASSQEHRKSSRYRAIAAELQKEIRLGTYSVGNLLPTETELMARYAASRQTIREALRLFEVTVTTHPEGRYIYGHAAVASVAHLRRRAPTSFARPVGSSWLRLLKPSLDKDAPLSW